MKERIKIKDTTLIGNWDEVQDYELSKVTKKDTDTQKLNGLVIRGYETKFSKVNENGERYEPGCLDEFIQSYFIDNDLNMVVDVQHGWGIDDQVGRVIYLETNTVGFYFVVYIPRTVARYEQIKSLLQRNIQILRNLHHNAPDTLPPDYVADFSVLLRRKIVQVLYSILIKAHVCYSHISLQIIF